jgi:hypothetical protein
MQYCVGFNFQPAKAEQVYTGNLVLYIASLNQ